MIPRNFERLIINSFQASKKDMVRLVQYVKTIEQELDFLKLQNNQLSNKVHQLQQEQTQLGKQFLDITIDVDELKYGKNKGIKRR